MCRFLLNIPDVQAFESRGYATIRVNEEVVSSVRRIFENIPIFFRRSKHDKGRDAIPALNEGWRGLGGEFSITPERPDLHESFWVTSRYEPEIRSRYSAIAMRLYYEMRHCITMLSEIERTVTKRLVTHLLGSDTNPGFDCDRDSDMQALYYQPSLHERECLQDPHDDSLYMTFIKAERRGLELKTDDGAYRAVEIRPDEILVMPGEILALLSGYRIRPLIHRVVRYSDQQERLALGYFTYPNIDANSTIDPWITNGTNKGIDIMKRVIVNQGQYLLGAGKSSAPKKCG
jgi:hypothetical protein